MRNIFLMIDYYDGMLIETGGRVGRGKLGGDKYVDECCMTIKEYILEGGKLEGILSYLDEKIEFYEGETQWIFQKLELKFLKELKERIKEL